MKYKSFSKKCLVVAVALTALCLAATSVMAAPIFYNFYGTGWGDINGVTFDATQVVINIPANTLNVSELLPGSGVWAIDNLTGSINIKGVVQGTFTDLLYVYCDNGKFGQAMVGLGDSTLGFDLLNIAPSNPAVLSNYDLQSFIGPISETGFVSQFGGIDITVGGVPGLNFLTLDFAEITFLASATAAPLPSGLWLLGSGLLTLVGIFRRNKS